MIPPEEQVVKADDVYADSSNTESDSDVRTLKYLGDYPELPIDAPVDCPHIIDLDSLDHEYFYLQGIGIADAVATILFKFMPAALAAFLDLDCPKFHYIQADQAASRLDFCIKRDGCMVTIGLLREKEFRGWHTQFSCLIDEKSTDAWTPVCIRVGDRFLETDPERLREEASFQAYSLLGMEPWHAVRPEQQVELVCGLSHERAF